MTSLHQVYKCGVCGNIVALVHPSDGTLVCCKQDMILLQENTTDAATEKHVPVIEKKDDGVLVKVGSVAHPMQDEHYIEWIELMVDGRSCRAFLKPGEAPEAFFKVDPNAALVAREYCNLHGQWKA